MPMTVNVAGQVRQIKLPTTKALWPLFETVVNSIQSLEDSNTDKKQITIEAVRSNNVPLKIDEQGKIVEERAHFESFIVTDNGNGFNTENYQSFLEAYSQLKVKKGCKGIGRFLWLKAFNSVDISSVYCEGGHWHLRKFKFTLEGIEPENNSEKIETEGITQQTTVTLHDFNAFYKESVAYSLKSLAKKLIEHCLPYFITGNCPEIILRDSDGECFNLNDYYKETYSEELNQDVIELKGKRYILYHMLLSEGADRHEIHLCANGREVKSYALSNYIPDMKKKLVKDEDAYYYVGYLTGEHLDESVNTERSDFDFSDVAFQQLFDEYCMSITDLSRACLAEYVAKRKAVVDLLGKALEADDRGKYSKESRIHSIICPMQTTSDEIKYDDMNLWLIDDRLAYHRFLASDKKMNSLPVLDSDVDKRMDLAVFDAALSYTADPDNINSITIVELKRPQRNDLDKEESDPIAQVYGYVRNIKNGKIKKANGRSFGKVQDVAFYCYVVADLTPTLENSAACAGLNRTQDGEGYFGYNPNIGTYIEVISYDKLLKDAKQRNKALFDKLFDPKLAELQHPELIEKKSD